MYRKWRSQSALLAWIGHTLLLPSLLFPFNDCPSTGPLGTTAPSSNQHSRLLESCGSFHLPPIHLIVNPTLSSVPLNNPQISSNYHSPTPPHNLRFAFRSPLSVYHSPERLLRLIHSQIQTFYGAMEPTPTRTFCTPPFCGRTAVSSSLVFYCRCKFFQFL